MGFGFSELILGIAAIGLGVIVLGLLIYYSIRIVQLLIKFVGHVFKTIFRWIGDIFRLIGAVVVAVVFVPLIVLNIVIGRWSASAHFGRAFNDECKTMGSCLYRIAIGHPLHLIGLRGLTEGIEQRLPMAVAAAPGADKPSRKRQGLFEGYTIVGSLQGGGSGGKLYVAEPDDIKRAAYERQGHLDVDRVVIKTFSLEDGSSLPQIVRESRALDAAKKLGLVLEHDLSAERFYYIMRYVPGDSLTVATQQLHARSDAAGLNGAGIQLAVGYTTDLLEALDVYHRGGLWHKDVKPDNLIVDRELDVALGRGKAHLVDFGLITPLRSAMTLTTHGTEYFRDPELVRQALRGVKVHQIDGGKFDVYAAGAVLFSIVENSFPAHGGLSQVSKKCPESIRWIIRRAMTDYDKRYATARAMLDDLTVVAAAADPYSVKPADLPSVSGNPAQNVQPEPLKPDAFDKAAAAAIETPSPVGSAAEVHAAASPVPPAAAAPAGTQANPASMPKLRVSDWWTGRYTSDDKNPLGNKAKKKAPSAFVMHADIGRGHAAYNAGHQANTPIAPALTPVAERASAKDQLKNAKMRAANRRARVGSRTGSTGRKFHPKHAALGPTARGGSKNRGRNSAPSSINSGVVLALIFGGSALTAGLIGLLLLSNQSTTIASTSTITDEYGNTHVISNGGYDAGQSLSAKPAPIVNTLSKYPAQASYADKYGDDADEEVESIAQFVLAPTTKPNNLGLALLTDFRPPFDGDFIADLRAAESSLGNAGVRTATSLFSSTLDDDAETKLAQLLALRGQSSLDSDLGLEITQLMSDHEGLDSVWWIGKGDDMPFRYLLVTPNSVSVFETDTPRLADIAESFVHQPVSAIPMLP